MVMLRTNMNTPDKHGQKNLGFFLQCNGETDSQLVSNIWCYSYIWTVYVVYAGMSQFNL